MHFVVWLLDLVINTPVTQVRCGWIEGKHFVVSLSGLVKDRPLAQVSSGLVDGENFMTRLFGLLKGRPLTQVKSDLEDEGLFFLESEVNLQPKQRGDIALEGPRSGKVLGNKQHCRGKHGGDVWRTTGMKLGKPF